MSENQYNEQMRDDELDLQELFLVLWRKKSIVIYITIISAIITGIFSIFFITPVFHSRLRIIINMPETYHTKYGDYYLPITSNEQYINLITSNGVILPTIADMGYNGNTTIETIRQRISIESPAAKANVEQNSYFVNVAADNPAEAQKLAQTLFDNYIEFLDVLVIEGAVDNYINTYNILLQSNEVLLNSAKELLTKNEELLVSTPQTINQKEAMKEISDSSSTSDFIILENIINPNYTKIESDVIANKQSINSIENSMKIYTEYLAELDVLKNKVNDYKKSDDYNSISNDFVSVTNTNLYLPSEPVVPNQKTSPSNAKNVIIGALLGGIVTVFVVLIREYWFKPDEEKESK